MTAAPPALAPRSAAELVELLRARPGRVRLCGGGSRQDRLPDAGDARLLRLDGIAAIERLDAPDQTCSVDCGVPREQLDAELQRVGLELPCPGGGTIGGLFASDPVGAATAGGQAPRTLLLGFEAVLADGTPFRSGARVVKSVAGFDVHKLLVGSHGRLFAATRLHLRLKPRPRAEQWFAVGDLELGAALARLRALRAEPLQPAALQLARDGAGRCTLLGRLAGRATFVAAMARTHGLPAAAPAWRDHLPLPPDGEVLAGLLLPSRIPALLAAAPADAPFLWHGGGRFELALPSPAAADALLATLPGLGVHACIVRGAPARRGHGTPLDPGQRRLADDLRHALDPHGMLA